MYGPQPQANSIPFWDVPAASLDLGSAGMSPWDTVLIGGTALPGRCSVRTKKHKRIDIKKSKGSSPPTMTLLGYNPAEVEITVGIWTPDQFRFLSNMMLSLLPKPRTKSSVATSADAVDIYHPSLVLLDIRSVIIEGIEALEQSTPKGLWTTKVRCLEWAPATTSNETSTPQGSQTFTVAHVITNHNNRLATTPDPANTDTGINRPLRSGLHTGG